jgi:hypothetical protein
MAVNKNKIFFTYSHGNVAYTLCTIFLWFLLYCTNPHWICIRSVPVSGLYIHRYLIPNADPDPEKYTIQNDGKGKARRQIIT